MHEVITDGCKLLRSQLSKILLNELKHPAQPLGNSQGVDARILMRFKRNGERHMSPRQQALLKHMYTELYQKSRQSLKDSVYTEFLFAIVYRLIHHKVKGTHYL